MFVALAAGANLIGIKANTRNAMQALAELILIKASMALAHSLASRAAHGRPIQTETSFTQTTVNGATGIEVEGAKMTEWNTETGPIPPRDPLAAPATASIEDIRYAQALRLQLRERYPDLPAPPPSFWCIGAD